MGSSFLPPSTLAIRLKIPSGKHESNEMDSNSAKKWSCCTVQTKSNGQLCKQHHRVFKSIKFRTQKYLIGIFFSTLLHISYGCSLGGPRWRLLAPNALGSVGRPRKEDKVCTESSPPPSSPEEEDGGGGLRQWWERGRPPPPPPVPLSLKVWVGRAAKKVRGGESPNFVDSPIWEGE